MIHPAGPGELEREEPATAPPPWQRPGDLARLACTVLWTTGPDPGRDGLFRVLALRRAPDGSWESLERAADPFPRLTGETLAGASARMQREFGVTGEELRDAVPPDEALAELGAFLEGRPVLTLGARAFRAWFERAGRGVVTPGPLLDLGVLATLLGTGRLASRAEELPTVLLGAPPELGPRAETPARLLDALGVLVGETLEREPATLSLLAHALDGLVAAFTEEHPGAAAELRLTARLLEHPSHLVRRGAARLYPAHRALDDGRLSDAVRLHTDLDDAAEAARPSWARAARAERRVEPLPAFDDEERHLDADDRRRVAEVFQEHLPRLFAERTPGATPSYRRGQYQVAREIAEHFGRHELHLLHAPTGTGKTLAYLVPALLWAWRNSIRVGVATYTRALQQQAMERDVPIARECLRRAGVTGEPRVALLKGRQNYLCWRALRLQTPLELRRTPPMELLAWTSVALFGLTDPDGDLDRLPRRAPLIDEAVGWRASLDRLVRQVRAESGCCSHQEDRDSCGADAARRRAERAHVVLTNHAFALARREYFRHLVFDECEHLHDVAHGAFSHAVSLRALRDFLERLYQAGGAGRRPLNRVAAVALGGSEAWECTRRCIEAWEAAADGLGELTRGVQAFKLWRLEVAGERPEADQHSLFREYVLEGGADELIAAHGLVTRAINELGAELAQLAEHLDTLATRSVRRLRRALDLLRAELAEKLEALEAWIPRTRDGGLELRPETFYDLETPPRGDDVLAARVLLPHEFLGRQYYPDLQGGTFLSATTWLKGGFQASATYLGLARAAEPAPGEDREPCAVATLRAPEAFDYSRVLVGVPRDAPSVRSGKPTYLGYVARFVAYLAERTRGRMLVLFTNADDLLRTARDVEPFLAARRIPFWYQRMEDASKEELGELFRGTVDSVLFGLDTFWYGADFPGTTLEYLVIVRLPYGVPDRYHHAQCASLGTREQRRQVYMPRALAKLRQGFGRLMRKETDRGCVFVLDARLTDPRHREFLRELPLRSGGDELGPDDDRLARLVHTDTDGLLREAFAHMGMGADVERRDLSDSFQGWSLERAARRRAAREERVELAEDDLPF